MLFILSILQFYEIKFTHNKKSDSWSLLKWLKELLPLNVQRVNSHLLTLVADPLLPWLLMSFTVSVSHTRITDILGHLQIVFSAWSGRHSFSRKHSTLLSAISMFSLFHIEKVNLAQSLIRSPRYFYLKIGYTNCI